MKIYDNDIINDNNYDSRLSNPDTLNSFESSLSSPNSNFSNNSNNNIITNSSNSSSTTQLSNEFSNFQLQQYPYKHLNGNLRILSNENYTDEGNTYILPIIKTESA